jgi:hypothetical protein
VDQAPDRDIERFEYLQTRPLSPKNWSTSCVEEFQRRLVYVDDLRKIAVPSTDAGRTERA